MAPPKQLITRPLGKNGPQVTPAGLGLMGASGIYGIPGSDAERLAFLDAAYGMGETFWDTADIYGDSEDLPGKWFALNPSKRKGIFLATKLGHPYHDPANLQGTRAINTNPEYCLDALEASLKRLGLPYVDLHCIHRLDSPPSRRLSKQRFNSKIEGKIKYLDLSEYRADSLRRAHATHPISCVHMEYNPFCLDIESPKYRLLERARELDAAIVAYSPLGNGLLSGTLRLKEDFTKRGDLRDEPGPVDRIGETAKAKGVTPAQLTLVWILTQGEDFFVIPGTTKAHRVAENLGSLDITITPEEEKAIRQASERPVATSVVVYKLVSNPAS
ncbi:NADP-dependent oxidoreductase domain-containing protein [Aspergillus novoparasiticus]|uniref:NADP-dependent oxidoreductase domain-containing protein n=1 Tax=Aspergillus novoparasiticus TaxID=986946 RepID=A0A5N6F8C8_9EURO|nr:NADP-dependent oxidoreductase domain-containing protein [Aspergillus novoparasiticus]